MQYIRVAHADAVVLFSEEPQAVRRIVPKNPLRWRKHMGSSITADEIDGSCSGRVVLRGSVINSLVSWYSVLLAD